MSQLFFKRVYQEAIRAGRKHTTIRRWGRPMVSAGRRAFSPGLGWLMIDAVDTVALEELDDRDAKADGFETAADMRKLLAELYPRHATDNKQWFRVKFSLDEPQDRTPKAHRNTPSMFG
jgi:hypothetical protein